MKKLLLESDHPIIFIFDNNNKNMQIPIYCKSNPVSVNSSCISVITKHYSDGECYVQMLDSIRAAEGELVFRGSISTPSKCLSVNTSEGKELLFRKIESSSARVTIWVDDTEHPSLIEFYFANEYTNNA